MTARKPVQISYEALHRIRQAAGGWPADLELSDLRRQLSKAIYEYHSFLALRDIKTQKARLRAIHKTASKLAILLKIDEENGILEWRSQWPGCGRNTTDGRGVGRIGNVTAKNYTRD
jgi:hypothetical protein